MKTRNALLSVYHKDGIVEFASELIEMGFAIYASGGTAKHLRDAGINVADVAGLVGGGAILGHRVVTLSREIHAGLLARDTPEDIAELANLGIPRFDLVCVDLYPLEEEITKSDCTLASVIEKTDIGGPTMIRSAVKGQRIVICDPTDRDLVISWLKSEEPDEAFKEVLAAKGEFTIAKYCMASVAYRSGGKYAGIFGERVATCKYGENAWQKPAELFSSGTDDPLALDKFKVIEGQPPSYNNWVDIDRLLQTMTHIKAAHAANQMTGPYIAIGGKHGNACGAAVGLNQHDVVGRMMDGDRKAIFGGIVMADFPIETKTAESIAGTLLDGIVAPGFSPKAIAMLRRKGNKCRFIQNPSLAVDSRPYYGLDMAPRFRYVRGGFLRQPNYTFILELDCPELKKFGKATGWQEADMLLAWAIGSTSNSNTITLVKDGMLIGNGVGQQDRVGAAKLAIERAKRSGHDTSGAVAYSDSFFPFPDGPEILIDADVSAILASSGSVRDQETIDVCQKHNIVLYMIPDSLGRGFFGH